MTEYIPNKKVAVRLTNPDKFIQQAEVAYTFEPAENGTSLSREELNSGLFKLLQPILLQRAKKDGQGDLENLKRLLET